MKDKLYLFSNLKGILIILVVFAHMLETTPPIINGDVGGDIYKFIYSFHMAAFLFISGYFSKKVEKGYDNAIERYLLPYIFMNLFCTSIRFILYGKASFNLLQPSFASWYLLTLFFYKIYLKNLLNIRFLFLISITASILIACINQKLAYLSIGRTVSFFPFFLLGYYFKYEWIKKIKNIPLKFYAVLFLVYIAAFIIVSNNVNTRKIFYFRDSYKSMHLSNLEGMFFHAVIMLIAVLVILFLLKFVQDRKTVFTYIGDRTMSIYILHPIFYYLSKKYNILNTGSNLDYLTIFLYTGIVVFVLSRDFIHNTLNKIFQFIGKILFNPNKENFQKSK